MGYRHNIATIEKKVYEQIKDLTAEELKAFFNESDYVPMDCFAKNIFELGKYYNDEFLKTFRTEVFSNEEVNVHFRADTDLYLISKEGFLAIIDSFREKVLNYYQDVMNHADHKIMGYNSAPSPEQFIQEKIRTWGENCTQLKLYPYNLTENNEDIVSSWEYEYAIFELVRIYKSINWDTQLAAITAG